mmetsp:Transcript_10856/g.44451  ORF Transcript_10856/g.44451 Transcript_10856/m.44451 type:complete len:232 (-) Transcript_10856:172-867(-)
MDAVEGGDEELMGVLLVVSGEVVGEVPDSIEDGRRRVGPLFAAEELCEEAVHLACQAVDALAWALAARVEVGEEVVPQQRVVRERLEDAVHEAGVAQVHEPPQAPIERLHRVGGAVLRQQLPLLRRLLRRPQPHPYPRRAHGGCDREGVLQLGGIDGIEVRVVDIVLALGAVEVAGVVEVNRKLVLAHLQMALDVPSLPAAHEDAVRANVKPTEGPRASSAPWARQLVRRQ